MARMNQPTSGRSRLSSILDGLTLLILCGAVVVFFTNRHGSSSANASATVAPLDSAFAPLRIVDGTGHSSLLTPPAGSRGLLVFVFKSDCPACAMQKSEWLRLAALARERNLQVVGLTLEEITGAARDYFGAGVLAARIADPAAAIRTLQVSVVPATILVTDRGRIAFHAMGVLDQPRTRLLEDML